MAPLTSTLVDDFSTLDSAVWDTFGLVTPSINANRLLIQTLADTEAAYAGVSTDISYSLLESSVFVKVLIGGPQSDSHEYIFSYQLDASNRLSIFNSGGYFAARVLTGGVANDTSVTYNATSHAWWKIAESGGTLTFSTSPDGASWSTLKTFATPAWVDADGADIALTVGHYGETEDDTYAFFDKLNVAASVTHEGAATLSGSSTFTARTLTNLVVNPSFETDLSSWGIYQHVGGTLSIARVAAADAPYGGYACEITVNPGFSAAGGGIAGGGNQSGTLMPVTAGETYSMACYTKAVTVPRFVNVLCAWFGPGGHISSDGGPALPNSTSWTRALVLTATAPPTATHVAVYFNFWETVPQNEVHLVDAFMVLKGATMPPYRDGDSSGWAWDAIDHASASYGLADMGTVERNGSATLAGSSTLTAVGRVERLGAATLAGTSAIIAPTLGEPTNLVINPAFEVDTAGWFGAGGAGYTTSVTRTNIGTPGWVARCLCANNSIAYGMIQGAGTSHQIPCVPGEKFGVRGRLVAASRVGTKGQVIIFWRNAANGIITTNGGSTASVGEDSLVVATAPALAVGFTVCAQTPFADMVNVVAGETADWDKIAAFRVSPTDSVTTMPAYFDGAYQGYGWTGTAHLSTSRKLAPLADPTNEIPNPKPSTTGTTYQNSGTSNTRVVDATSPTGTALVVSTTGTNDPHVYPSPGVTLNTNDMYFRGRPGEVWTLSAWVKVVDAGSQAAVGTSRPSISIWYKTTGHTSLHAYSTSSAWTRISVTQTLPASNLNAFFIRLYAGWNIAGGSEVRFAGIRFTKGTDTTYIDGDTAGYGWAGTADSAPSRQLSYIGEVTRNGAATLSGSSALTAAGVVEKRGAATFNNVVNIAPNPSFETNFSYVSGNGVSTVSRSSLDAAVGSWSTKVDCTALWDGVAFLSGVAGHSSIPTNPGRTFSFGCYVKAPAGTAMTLENSERTAIGGALRQSGVYNYTASGDWEWVTTSSVVGTDCPGVRPKVYQNVAGTRTFYVDGLVAVNGTPPSTYFEQNISAGGLVERRAASTLAGSSTLTAAAQVERNAASTLAGDSTAVAAGRVEKLGEGTLAGDSTFIADGQRVALADATLTGESELPPFMGTVVFHGEANLSGETNLDADGLLEVLGSTNLEGVSSIAGIGSFEFGGAATLVGYSTVIAMPQNIGEHMSTGRVRIKPSGHVSGSRGGRVGRIKARIRETTFGRVHS